jgi:hypothetical protein
MAMMKNPTENSNVEASPALSPREEIAVLLAWQSTGRLSRREQDQLDSYLAAHPEDLALRGTITDEANAVRRANADIASPSRAGFDRLLASLPSQTQASAGSQPLRRRPNVSTFTRWQERCVEFIASLSPNQVGWATVAFGALILTQVALIGSLVKKSTGSYEIASGPTDRITRGATSVTAPTALALVTLAPDASTEAMTKVLVEIGCEIVGGPKSGGLYRVALTTAGPITAEATAAALARLKQHPDLFARVLPAPKL